MRNKSVRPPATGCGFGVTLSIDEKKRFIARQKYRGGGFAYIRRGKVPDRKKKQMIKITKCKVGTGRKSSVQFKHEVRLSGAFYPQPGYFNLKCLRIQGVSEPTFLLTLHC